LIICDSNASNYIKIATIGSPRAKISISDKDKDMQSMVDHTIAFWDYKINRVIPDKPDLIVLPELCDFPIGLSKEERIEYLKIRKNQVINHFSTLAKANNCYIAFGTMLLEGNDNFRNSRILLDRTGKTVGIYDKNFPTIGEIEAGVRPGTESPVFECDFGSVAFAICFDLNFEELLEQYKVKKRSEE